MRLGYSPGSTGGMICRLAGFLDGSVRCLGGVCRVWLQRSNFRLVKSVTGLFPRSTSRTGHRPPFDFSTS